MYRIIHINLLCLTLNLQILSIADPSLPDITRSFFIDSIILNQGLSCRSSHPTKKPVIFKKRLLFGFASAEGWIGEGQCDLIIASQELPRKRGRLGDLFLSKIKLITSKRTLQDICIIGAGFSLKKHSNYSRILDKEGLGSQILLIFKTIIYYSFFFLDYSVFDGFS